MHNLNIEVGDMITDPDDRSLGIIIDYCSETQRYKIHWCVNYFGVTNEKIIDFLKERYVKVC